MSQPMKWNLFACVAGAEPRLVTVFDFADNEWPSINRVDSQPPTLLASLRNAHLNPGRTQQEGYDDIKRMNGLSLAKARWAKRKKRQDCI
jgi:hypothetical protein